MQPKLPRNELEEGKRAVKGVKHRGGTSAPGWRKSNTTIDSGRCIGVLLLTCSAVTHFPRQLTIVREKTLGLLMVPARPLFMLVQGKEE